MASAGTGAVDVALAETAARVRTTERALKNAGMVPRLFEAAETAMATLNSETPDVLMTDIRMSGKSGLELLRNAQERFGCMAGDGDDPVRTETGGVHLTDAPADVGLFPGGRPDHCDGRIAHCARASSASPVRRRVVQSSIARAPRRS
jgi:hypothetical protein